MMDLKTVEKRKEKIGEAVAEVIGKMGLIHEAADSVSFLRKLFSTRETTRERTVWK